MKYSDIYNHDNNELHRDVKEEILFFHSAVKGDMKAIQKNIEDRRFRDQNGVGTLSVDPVLNLKYHMVITTGILTRLCIEKGLNAETAFRMSDYYIKKLDNAKTEDDQSVDVLVKGVQSVIDNIKADDIIPYIDLSGYTAGEHEVEVLIENNDPRIEYVVTKKINVVIK